MKKLFLFIALFSIISNDAFAQYADCDKAIFLCSKENILVNQLNGAGADDDEFTNSTCGNKFKETNSAWFKFRIAKSGSLTFKIRPIANEDDLDFVVFQVLDSKNSCLYRKELRCMASGMILGEDSRSFSQCVGMTGLLETANDIVEKAGCDDTQDSFLAPIAAEKDATYVIAVNNYASTKGFLMEFGGTATFGNVPQVYAEPSEEPAANKQIFNFSFPLGSGLEEEINDNFAAGLGLSKIPMESMIESAKPLYGYANKTATLGCYQPVKGITPKTLPIQHILKGSTDFSVSEVFPNPTRTDANVYIDTKESQVCRVVVTDILGRVQYSAVEMVLNGIQKLNIPLQTLPASTYQLTIFVKNEQINRKIVKI